MARPKLIQDENDLLLQAYQGMLDKYYVMNTYNVSAKTAERMIKKLGLTHTSQHIIDIVRRYSEGETCSDLAKEYGVSETNIRALLERRDIERRGTHYNADFHYFDAIDSEDKAYFLGFIYADGCLHNNSLKVSLASRDIDILEKLKECMKANHPILTRPNAGYSGKDKSGECSILLITHKYIREGLMEHGVMESKTMKLTFPSLPDLLLKHFIRGYIDGDGSFTHYVVNGSHNKYEINIVGTIDFLESLRSVLQKNLGLSLNSTLKDRHPDRQTNIRQFQITGRRQVLTILDWLYKDATVYLDRKYEKYLQLPK